jgi:hypothetical protein
MKALALDSRGLAVTWSVWLLAASIIPANQTGTVRGVVRAKGQPVPYANVIVIGTRLGAMADSAGRFTLKGVPSGLRLIQA